MFKKHRGTLSPESSFLETPLPVALLSALLQQFAGKARCLGGPNARDSGRARLWSFSFALAVLSGLLLVLFLVLLSDLLIGLLLGLP